MYCIVSDCFLINYSNEKIPLKIEEPHLLLVQKLFLLLQGQVLLLSEHKF